MSEYRYLALLVVIMAGVALLVGAIAIGVFYHAALDEARSRLTETVQSQARLIEAMVQFNPAYTADPASVRAAALAQIKKVHLNRRIKPLKKTVEVVLA